MDLSLSQGEKRALSSDEKVEVDEAKRVLRRYVRTGDGRCNMCDDDDDYIRTHYGY